MKSEDMKELFEEVATDEQKAPLLTIGFSNRDYDQSSHGVMIEAEECTPEDNSSEKYL